MGATAGAKMKTRRREKKRLRAVRGESINSETGVQVPQERNKGSQPKTSHCGRPRFKYLLPVARRVQGDNFTGPVCTIWLDLWFLYW